MKVLSVACLVLLFFLNPYSLRIIMYLQYDIPSTCPTPICVNLRMFDWFIVKVSLDLCCICVLLIKDTAMQLL